MSKQAPPASTASAVGPCLTIIKIGRTALEVYPAPSHHPTTPAKAKTDFFFNIVSPSVPHISSSGAGVFGSLWYRIPHLGSLVGCFGFSGPLRQYFSLYRAVSQGEGERGEK